MIATFGMNSVVVGEKRVRCSGLTGRIGDIGGDRGGAFAFHSMLLIHAVIFYMLRRWSKL